MSVKTMMLVSSAMEQRRTHRNRDERVVTEGQSQGSPKRKAGVTEGQRQGSPKGKGRGHRREKAGLIRSLGFLADARYYA